MRYIIYGAGAIGGTLGALLFATGHDPIVIARGENRRVLAERGLTFARPHGATTYPIPVVAAPAEIAWQADDVVFLTMKSQDTAAALAELAAVAPPGVHVVCAQNGVENERLALRSFAYVHGMCVKIAAVHLEPGVVRVYGVPRAGIFDVGRYPHGRDTVDVQIAGDLEAAGAFSDADAHVMERKYAKLLTNVTNTLEAAAGDAARTSPLRERARDEALACFGAAGIVQRTPPHDAERAGGMVQQPIAGGRHEGNSTWQSLIRATGAVEADALNGEIVLLGRLHGIRTPVNAMLQQLGHRMARERLAPGSIALADLEREVAAHAQ